MFTFPCIELQPHNPHTYTKCWRKRDLPMLRDPENYPDSWNATYKCRGIREEDLLSDEEWDRRYGAGFDDNGDPL